MTFSPSCHLFPWSSITVGHCGMAPVTPQYPTCPWDCSSMTVPVSRPVQLPGVLHLTGLCFRQWVTSSACLGGAHALVEVHVRTQSRWSSALGLFRERTLNLCFQWSSGVTDFPDGSQYPQCTAFLAQGLCPLVAKKGNQAQAAESIFAFLNFLCLGRRSKNTENKLLFSLVDVFPKKAVWEGQKRWEHGASLFLGWTGQVSSEYG